MKQVIKKDRVQVSEYDADAGEGGSAGSSGPGGRTPVARAPHAQSPRGPGVHLVRIDGRVQAIELTCRCGDISVLEIDYDDTTQPTEVTS